MVFFPTKKTRNFYEFFSTKTEASTVKYYFRCKVLFSTRKPRFRRFFITKRSFPPKKNRNFFSTKTVVSTVKYYFKCKVLFSTRKRRFRCYWYFYYETVLPTKKTRNFCMFFSAKTEVSTVKAISDVKYSFLPENLVLVLKVKLVFLLRNGLFSNEKNTKFLPCFSLQKLGFPL